jgi:hypothetical protein
VRTDKTQTEQVCEPVRQKQSTEANNCLEKIALEGAKGGGNSDEGVQKRIRQFGWKLQEIQTEAAFCKAKLQQKRGVGGGMVQQTASLLGCGCAGIFR